MDAPRSPPPPPPTSGSGSAHPLRPYYTPPLDDTTFIPPPSFPSSSARPSSSKVSPSSPPKTFNRYSSLGQDDAAIDDGLGGSSTTFLLRSLVGSALLQYTSTALAMPFEVGKCLLQVQWIPKEDVWTRTVQAASASAGVDAPWYDREDADAEGGPGRDFGGEDDELSDEAEAEAYFQDLKSRPSRPPTTPARSAATSGAGHGEAAPLPSDAVGYVVRSSVFDEEGRPEHVLPIVDGGVWEMIKAVARSKEGWLGLWKGTFTTFLLDTATSTLQPVVSTFLSFFYPASLTPFSTLPLVYNPRPLPTLCLLLSSHVVTGVLLSPLDLVRTRLIVQSNLGRHRSYAGPLDALRKIVREEGGWRTTYLHPHLFLPALLDNSIRPLLSLSTPLLIERWLHLSPLESPVTYGLAELVLSTAALFIVLPIETVRRRLQVQRRPRTGRGIGDGPAVRSCVEVRPVPYVGMVDAVWRILTEETSKRPPVRSSPKGGAKKGNSKSAKGAKSKGKAEEGEEVEETEERTISRSLFGGGRFKQLYRGFGMGFGANLVVFILGLVGGERAGQVGNGWAEM